MTFDRIPVRGPRVALAVSGCTALMLSAGLAMGEPTKSPTPVKADQVEGGLQSGAKGRAERVRMPSRGPTVDLDITGLDSKFAVATPAWASKTAKLRTAGGANAATAASALQIQMESSLIVEGASREDVYAALAETGVAPSKAWLAANVRPIAQSDTSFAVQFPTVRLAINAASTLLTDDRIEHAEVSQSYGRSDLTLPTDPLVSIQYFFDNPFPDIDIGLTQDHGLSEAYDLGYTGQGVVVGVLEAYDYSYQAFSDGVDLIFHAQPAPSHPDLIGNHRQDLSQTYNPFTETYDYFHGNGVAGLIAATANNGEGGAGVAYNADLAAMRNGLSLAQSEAFQWRNDAIRVKNHSWGFPTLAGTILGFGQFGDAVADVAVYQETAPGRALRGSQNTSGVINVVSAGNNGIWASEYSPYLTNFVGIDFEGNYVEIGATDGTDTWDDTWAGVGGRTEYSSTAKWREVLAIAAVGEDNEIAGYSTTGTNVVAAAYSQGYDNNRVFDTGSESQGFILQRGIVTADALDGFDLWGLGDGYQTDFNGTSAAAPIASGIVALMLEANPNLTVRDIKHIFQQTADWTRIPDAFEELANGTYISPDEYASWWIGFTSYLPNWWQVNGGYQVHSDEYGFGIIDGEAAVRGAAQWGGAPKLFILDSGVIEEEVGIPDAQYVETGDLSESVLQITDLTTFPNICVRQNFLIEDVELTVTITGAHPGDLMLGLYSGSGTYSSLAFPRVDNQVTVVDGENYGYYEYKFNSLKHWGEYSGGNWFLLMYDRGPTEPPSVVGEEDPPATAYATFPPGTTIGWVDGEEHSLVSWRLRIFGTKTGKDPYSLCRLGNQSCPGDIDGDGYVTPKDLLAFAELYLAGSFVADIDNNGIVDYYDLIAFYTSWLAGPCGGPRVPGTKRSIDGEVIDIG